MSSTVVTSGLGYLYWLTAARTLPQSTVGTATALISVATVVSMVSNLGAGHMFIQRLPASDRPAWTRTVTAGLLLACAATALTSALTALLAPSFSPNFTLLDSIPGAGALLVTAVSLTASTLLDYVFIAHRASHGMLWRNFSLATGKVVTLLTLTAAGLHTPAAILLAWTVPSVAVTLCTLTRVRLVAHPDLDQRPKRRPIPGLSARRMVRVRGLAGELRHLRGSLTGHHLINLAQAGPSALVPVLVTARLGAEANAHFYVVWMTASVLFMVSPAVASAFYAERTNAAGARLPKAAAVVAAVIGPPALVLFVFGGWVLGLFNHEYAESGDTLLKILVLAAVPDAITNLAVAHWRSQGRFRRCLKLNLIMAVTCLGLTWIWLPTMGITGAGLAWLAGQTAGAVSLARVRRRRARRGADSRAMRRAYAARRGHLTRGLHPAGVARRPSAAETAEAMAPETAEAMEDVR